MPESKTSADFEESIRAHLANAGTDGLLIPVLHRCVARSLSLGMLDSGDDVNNVLESMEQAGKIHIIGAADVLGDDRCYLS